MSTSGVAVLDHTVQETNVWLRIGADQPGYYPAPIFARRNAGSDVSD
jgi:hypothetical protein